MSTQSPPSHARRMNFNMESGKSSGRKGRQGGKNRSSVGNARPMPVDIVTINAKGEVGTAKVHGAGNSTANHPVLALATTAERLKFAHHRAHAETKSKLAKEVEDREDIMDDFEKMQSQAKAKQQKVEDLTNIARASIEDGTKGMKNIVNLVPFANGLLVTDISTEAQTVNLCVNIDHVDVDRHADTLVDPVNGKVIEIPDHLIMRQIEEAVKGRMRQKPIVLWKEIHISHVQQHLIHGGGHVAVAAAIKTPPHLRDTPEGPMKGDFDGDLRIFQLCSKFGVYHDLLQNKNLSGEEQAQLKAATDAVEKLEASIKAAEASLKTATGKQSNLVQSVQLRNDKAMLRAQQMIKRTLEKKLEEAKTSTGLPDNRQTMSYFVNEAGLRQINRGIKSMANHKAVAGAPESEYSKLFTVALKELIPHFSDCRREVAAPVPLFTTDAMTQMHEGGMGFKIPLAEAYALENFDHERHLEFARFMMQFSGSESHEAARKAYARIKRVLPKNGLFRMGDPRLSFDWFKLAQDKLDDSNSRRDPIGYAMLISAPRLLWKEYAAKTPEAARNDQDWKKFVTEHLTTDGELSLDRKLFYEHLEEISRLATLYDTITPLGHLELHLFPAASAIIKKNVWEKDKPTGERGYFSCKLHLKVKFLNLPQQVAQKLAAAQAAPGAEQAAAAAAVAVAK